jgi:hypothetical protein
VAFQNSRWYHDGTQLVERERESRNILVAAVVGTVKVAWSLIKFSLKVVTLAVIIITILEKLTGGSSDDDDKY